MSAQLSYFLSRPPYRALGQGLILSAVTALLVVWSLAVPIFESPDEGAHWQYARYLNAHWRLPIYGSDFVEANSPPLYYAIIAPFAIKTEVPTIYGTMVWISLSSHFHLEYIRTSTAILDDIGRFDSHAWLLLVCQ